MGSRVFDSSYTVRVSYVEIYNELVFDLLGEDVGG